METKKYVTSHSTGWWNDRIQFEDPFFPPKDAGSTNEFPQSSWWITWKLGNLRGAKSKGYGLLMVVQNSGAANHRLDDAKTL